MKLHGFHRSTASYRVRIALALKGIAHENAYYVLRKGDQRTPAYLELNPQGLVPSLELDDGSVLTQSLAICEYLDETRPEPPLLPHTAHDKAKVRALAQVIACDVHPVQNLKILARLREFGVDEAGVEQWARTTIEEGLHAFDVLIADCAGTFCFGDQVTLADICLVPQLANAARFGVDYAQKWPRLARIEKACLAIGAFAQSKPEAQLDAI
ncbi:maleylacetoacetate isomerase [Novosphingobium profundi]|uniref:maleylacetoacetate isomerase n=1 Tax=Novosphingobium profundi TaxID=1774954 RepID=UPI001BDB27FE|nr:maleylacetoacetate isomerase [Novosphingobium profundi]MBT0667315.1 maleylacetoacetate isomerase [Novosphingobium profundi]